MSGIDIIASSLFFLSTGLVLSLQQFRKSKAPQRVRISELHIFPIKSCAGIQVQSSIVTKRGFKYDRLFMVVDADGKFVSQRKRSKMALIQTRIDESRGTLIATAPNMPTLEVPLKESPTEGTMMVTVWESTCEAKIVETNDWFATYLDIPGLKLVRFADNSIRPTDPDYAPKGQTGFADGFPFLIASEESINEMNRRADFEISMSRFRPNIIVSGCVPFAEDSWGNIEFKSQPPMKARICKPCARCSIPDIDPVTAVYDKEMKVSRLMQTFRTGKDIKVTNEKWNKQLFFGQNIDHEAQENVVISVGDEIYV